MSSYSSLLSLSPAEYPQVGGHAGDVGDDDDMAVAATVSSYLSCFDMDVVGEYYPPEADFHSAPPPAAADDYKNGDGESMDQISRREAGAVLSSPGLSSHGKIDKTQQQQIVGCSGYSGSLGLEEAVPVALFGSSASSSLLP
ncbi:hypothetical protein ABZP36_016152 [Zizania latifolia]